MTTTEASAAADAGPALLPPAQRTLPALLQAQAERFGDRPLLRLNGQRWTHADPARAASACAARLAASGMARTDRVAIMSGNRIEFLQVFLGAGWLGAVSVPINTASMGPQIGYFLANSQARLLVIEAEFAARLEEADLAATALAEVWLLDADDALRSHCAERWPAIRWVRHGSSTSAPSGDAGWAETETEVRAEAEPEAGADAVAKAQIDAAPLAPCDAKPGDPLAILYTSGTTGPAKGVVCPHAQYFWWGFHSAQVLGVGRDDVLCTTLPLFHINALNTFAQAALTGCEVVFESRFSASGFWASMQASGATVVYLLGAMVPILLAQPASAAERAHRVRVGLGPGVPEAAARDFLARTGVRLLEGYGSTETNFAIATRPDSPRGGVMGWLRPGFEARVADEDDLPLADGQPGELLLRADAPHAFCSGYFGMPEQTVAAWRNLWFHTGDRVVREADGAFRFIDRIKDAIRRRGENISSFEVEQVLLGHPAVAACAVFPVRSELAEDEVMTALVLREGQAVSPEALTEFCETRLPYFAVPRYVELMAELPRTENGKIQKFKLRERGVTPETWDRGPARRVRPKD